MKKALKVKRDYPRMSDGNFETKAGTINACCTNNQYFPSPPITMKALANAISLYSAALILAKNRGAVEISDKNDKRQAVTVMLDTLSAYCVSASNGSRTILLSSGFTVVADAGSAGALGTPTGLKIIAGDNSGDLILKMPKVLNARSYFFTYALSPNEGTWMIASSTRPTVKLFGLKTLTLYDFKGAAVGVNETKYTAMITKSVS